MEILYLKNKLSKILLACCMFIFLGAHFVFGMDKSAPPAIPTDDRCAKVVILGYLGSGKTVFYNLLTDKLKTVKYTDHTKNTDVTNMEYDIGGRKIQVYFCDTSAEPRHKDVMDRFCDNANIVIAIVNAFDLVNKSGNPLWVPAGQMHFEELMGRLPKIAPKCRVIVVLTQKGCLGDDDNAKKLDDAWVWEDRIDSYIGSLDKMLAKKNIFVDSKYDLTLREKTIQSDETRNHKYKLEDLIADSLKKYGIENLPKTPEGFESKIFEKSFYKQNKYFIFTGKKEFSHKKYFLVDPDYKINKSTINIIDDEHIEEKTGKDSAQITDVKQKLCSIF